MSGRCGMRGELEEELSDIILFRGNSRFASWGEVGEQDLFAPEVGASKNFRLPEEVREEVVREGDEYGKFVAEEEEEKIEGEGKEEVEEDVEKKLEDGLEEDGFWAAAECVGNSGLSIIFEKNGRRQPDILSSFSLFPIVPFVEFSLEFFVQKEFVLSLKRRCLRFQKIGEIVSAKTHESRVGRQTKKRRGKMRRESSKERILGEKKKREKECFKREGERGGEKKTKKREKERKKKRAKILGARFCEPFGEHAARSGRFNNLLFLILGIYFYCSFFRFLNF